MLGDDAPLHRLCSPEAGPGVPPRVLLVAAHPDDEVIGAGSRLARLGARASVVYVTDGAPADVSLYQAAGFQSRDDYASARRREARRALALCGIDAVQTHELGAVDQQAALALPELCEGLIQVLLRERPELVLTHPYEGGHPDHDATALLSHVACELLRRRGRPAPALGEFASYHQSGGALIFGEFLPSERCDSLEVELSPAQLDAKLTMLSCHETQRGVWRLFPLGVERFRNAPRYDFRLPPAAPFFYDQMSWGIRGRDFLELSRAGLAALGIEDPC